MTSKTPSTSAENRRQTPPICRRSRQTFPAQIASTEFGVLRANAGVCRRLPSPAGIPVCTCLPPPQPPLGRQAADDVAAQPTRGWE